MEISLKKVFIYLSLTSIVFLLASCAGQPTPTAYNPPGFFMGLLHGFLIFFSFIGSIFIDIRMYAFPNTGVMYDFGYIIGASLFLGGGGASSR